MTDLDQAFKQRIRQHPDDELPRQIYADWLEEQGDVRGLQVRLFQEAVNGLNQNDPDPLAFWQLVDSMGDFVPLVHSIDEYSNRFLAVEIAYQTEGLSSNRYILSILRDVWDRPYDLEQIAGEINQRRVWSLVYGEPLLDALFQGDATQAVMDVAYWSRMGGDDWEDYDDPDFQKIYLIAASFKLFGRNILPDSFERTGL